MTNDLTKVEPQEVATSEAREDFVETRQNYEQLAGVATKSVNELSQLAEQSQSPRFYEVLAETLRVASELNDKRLDQHKKIKDLQGTQGPQQVTNQIVMTSAAMLEMIKGNKDG